MIEFNVKSIEPRLKIDGNIELLITTDKKNIDLNIVEETNSKLLEGKTFICNICPKKVKRSLDSNAYFWGLADKLAERLSLTGDKPITKEEIYQSYIKDIPGENEILPIKDCAVEKFISSWQSKGLGWVCEVIGQSKLTGYTNVIAYYGSSCFSKKSMSMLIDMVVEDCKEYGIETKTPEEIAKLKALWGEK